MLKIKIIFTFLIVIAFSGCKTVTEKSDSNTDLALISDVEKVNPDFTNLDFEVTSNAKNKIQLENKVYVAAFEKLLRIADKALAEGPFSVVNKTQTPVSGDKHDYLSLGPYWWPDLEKVDGLPWIRKDGEINPLTRGENVDEPRKNEMFGNTYKLGLAYYFSDDQKYADKALELLKVWFINADTKMNPNLNYAQGLPGTNNGRGIGIIEFTGISNIISTIEILEYKNALDTTTSEQLRVWFTNFLDWYNTSENGIFEKNTKNNHGTWYDVQVVNMLLFLNKKEEAKNLLESVKLNRIATQISEDGKQPHELARTKSLSYSTMNLNGFTVLAYQGKKLGVDLWNYKPQDAGGIKDAYDFLYPYAIGAKEWKLEQLSDKKEALEKLRELFAKAGGIFENQKYCTMYDPVKHQDAIDILLNTCNN